MTRSGPGPRSWFLEQLVGGQLQPLQVGAQRCDVDGDGVGLLLCGLLLLAEEDQLLGHRGLLVREDVVRVTVGAAGRAQPCAQHSAGHDGAVVAQRVAWEGPLPRVQRKMRRGLVGGRPAVGVVVGSGSRSAPGG